MAVERRKRGAGRKEGKREREREKNRVRGRKYQGIQKLRTHSKEAALKVHLPVPVISANAAWIRDQPLSQAPSDPQNVSK